MPPCGFLVILAVMADAPATRAAAPPTGLPPAVSDALARTQDFAFNFDQPGFYALVELVRAAPLSAGYAPGPLRVDDWSVLLERPADHRGRLVTVTGVVGRNKDPFELASRPDLGLLTQVELRGEGQPIACTLIFTQDAASVPVGATIEATGYFLMIRQYHGDSGQIRLAALIVSPGPTLIERAAAKPTRAQGEPTLAWLFGALLVGLLSAVVILRRGTKARRVELGALRASRPASQCVADDLARWAAEQERGRNGGA